MGYLTSRLKKMYRNTSIEVNGIYTPFRGSIKEIKLRGVLDKSHQLSNIKSLKEVLKEGKVIEIFKGQKETLLIGYALVNTPCDACRLSGCMGKIQCMDCNKCVKGDGNCNQCDLSTLSHRYIKVPKTVHISFNKCTELVN